jgi:hypothetical protein
MYATNQGHGFWMAWFLGLTIAPALVAADAGRHQEQIAAGEQLFIQEFSVGKGGPNGGDGLGPLFNHVSCAACHRQGALGGGGGIEFNVSLISAQLDASGPRPDPRVLRVTLKGLHPAFVGDNDRIVPTILLHRFGSGEKYFQLKSALGGQFVPLDPDKAERNELQKRLTAEPHVVGLFYRWQRLVRAQRNTTALFGAGLIDQIPDGVFHRLEEKQTAEGKVSGRVPPIGADRVGRFGWRGPHEHLHHFVLGAGAQELGLEVPRNPQPLDPLRPNYRPAGLDLSADQCASLTAYVASLEQPRVFQSRQPFQSSTYSRGRELFTSIGCAECHLEQVDSVKGIYSDLLLHDMGPRFADPVLAEPSLVFIRRLPPDPSGSNPQPPPVSPGMYYGGSTFQDLVVTGPRPTSVEIKDPKTGDRNIYQVAASNLQSEWRTPPLWGLGDSPPYLHDGRAATVNDAIESHGGEAEFAVKQYQELELTDRVSLVNFLHSLRAP